MKSFTDLFIKGLKPKEKKYVIREARGFAIQVRPTGAKNFVYIFKMGGKKYQHDLGKYPDVKLSEAREKYKSASLLVGRGVVPSEELKKEKGEKLKAEKPEEITLGMMADRYLEWSAEGNHSDSRQAVVKWTVGKYIKGKIRDVPINSLKRSEAMTFISMAKGEYGPAAAENLLKVMQGIYTLAYNCDYVTGSPFTGMKKALPSIKQSSRERVLSGEEIKTVWKAIEEGGGDEATKRALKLVLITAQRPGEVAGMHSREIEGDWWVIPLSRIKKTKADKPSPSRVYLTSLAKKLIGDAEGFIFPSPDDWVDGAPTKSIGTAALSRVVRGGYREGKDKKKIVVKNVPYYGLPRWTPHDLRRTTRTNLARLGVRWEVCEAIINHAKGTIDATYNLYEYDAEKKEAMLRWEEELLHIVG